MIDSVLPLPVSLAITTYTLAYVPPGSNIRLLAGLLIAIFNWIAAQSTVARSFPGFIGPEYILGFILLSNNWLNLARLHYKPPAKGYEQPYARLRWAIYQIFDLRWSVSSSQTPSFDKKRPQWVPSRQYFLLWKIWTMIWCGAIVYVMKHFEPLDIPDIVSTPAGFLYRLTDMTLRETLLRIYYGFGLMVSSYCCLCFMHAVCGFIAVALFRDDPAGWKPLHGSPSEALGMRGFYHKFWHHCMRKGFTAHAIFLINDILRFPRKSPVTRYLIVLVSFLISGLYHAALTPDLPLQCSMLQIGYQLRVVGAIVFEDIVSTLWKKFAPRSQRLQHDKEAAENGSANTPKSKALSPGQDPKHTELRRRNEKNSTREYPKSPMPMTPTVNHNQGKSYPPMNWVTILLYAVGYLWTAAFLVWVNSTLVWSTSKCVIDLSWSEEDKQDYFDSHTFNDPF